VCQDGWQLPAEAFELRLDADEMEDAGIFEMSDTSVSETDLYGESCVVSEWLTRDDDNHSVGAAAGDIVDVTSVNQQPAVNKSALLPTSKLTLAVTESPVKQEILNTTPYCHTLPMSLDFTDLIVDLVHQYAAQVSVSFLLHSFIEICDLSETCFTFLFIHSYAYTISLLLNNLSDVVIEIRDIFIMARVQVYC